MKKKTVWAVCLVCVLILVALCGCTSEPNSAEQETEQEGEQRQKTILYLGDSIAEAMAGPSPLTEREDYAYYGLLGNMNGFRFVNRAVSGYQTKDLLQFIMREDDGINMVNSYICTADIIHISILGNDLLGYDFNGMLIEAGSGKYDMEDERLEIAYNNLCKIIDRLKEMNPDAILIFQTLYNPVSEDSPLVYNYAKWVLSAKSYSAQYYHSLAGKMITRLNDLLYRYLEENTKYTITGKVAEQPFYIADVYTEMEKIYETNRERWLTMFCPDGVHPANEGHAVIADVNQKLFEELGIASSEALSVYKEIRCEQLERLYSTSVAVSSVKKTINDCESIGDVTLAYFNETREKSPYYKSEPDYTVGTHFEEDKFFTISTFRFMQIDLTRLALPVEAVPEAFRSLIADGFNIFSDESYIMMNADGTFEMSLTVNPGLMTLLKWAVDNNFLTLPVNLSDFINLDINYLQTNYLSHMFPGFDYNSLLSSLELLEKAIGLKIKGLDMESEATREMAEELAESGNLLFSSLDIFAEDEPFSIVWSDSYHIEEITSELTGETYIAVYIGQEQYTGESYLRFTYRESSEDEGGSLRLVVDVVDVELEAKE